MLSPTLCTIIAKNYIAFARTLCGSFLSFHPQGKCFVLIIDDWKDYIRPEEEQFEIISLGDLVLPQPREHFAFKYDITELSTAVKPFLLSHLLQQRGVKKVLYLDPDVLVTAPLDGILHQLDQANAVLTPHLDSVPPDDGKLPTDAGLLVAGVFNLGFIALRAGETARRFLEWWQERLTDHCVNEPERGYFVDQRFLDIAFVSFPGFVIEKDTGYNAAYWNLHSRAIAQAADGRWLCNGAPLYFFHFSNYRPHLPDIVAVISDRHTFAERPDLVPLFAEYRARVMAHGYEACRQWPYSHGTFANGRKISPILRARYRVWTEGEIPGDNPFASKSLCRMETFLRLDALLAERIAKGKAGVRRRFRLLLNRSTASERSRGFLHRERP